MEMINIKIDNKEIQVNPGTTVLDAAKSVADAVFNWRKNGVGSQNA